MKVDCSLCVNFWITIFYFSWYLQIYLGSKELLFTKKSQGGEIFIQVSMCLCCTNIIQDTKEKRMEVTDVENATPGSLK